jgi:hypothetical protein
MARRPTLESNWSKLAKDRAERNEMAAARERAARERAGKNPRWWKK